jgi:menaquinol-cytochrome c reductase iron-sulfur subunit
MKRRTAAGLLVATGTAVVSGVVGLPVLIAGLAPIWQPRGEHWRTIGPLEQFAIGKTTRAAIAIDRDTWPKPYGEQAAYVWRPNETDVVVFSQSCTDLGCPLQFEPGSACFLCPCHGGIFAQDGRRLAGPPKSPMLRYSHRVRNGLLEVDIASLPPAA